MSCIAGIMVVVIGGVTTGREVVRLLLIIVVITVEDIVIDWTCVVVGVGNVPESCQGIQRTRYFLSYDLRECRIAAGTELINVIVMRRGIAVEVISVQGIFSFSHNRHA